LERQNCSARESRLGGLVGEFRLSKFLLLVVAIIVIYLVVRGFARKRHGRAGPPLSEQMVPCAHCRVNLPRSEAIEVTGRFFCSEEHRRLGAG